MIRGNSMIESNDKYLIIKILFIKITIKKKPTKSDLYDFENRLVNRLDKIIHNSILLNMSENINYNTFLKHKNINYGKEVVLIATGPTLNKYIPIKNAINVGVNQAIYYDKVKIDYYFLQDCKNSTKDIPEIFPNLLLKITMENANIFSELTT